MITYTNKRAVTLSIGSGQKEYLRVKINQQSLLSFKYTEFVLREIIFVTDVGGLTIETFFNKKKSLCLNRSF